MGSEMCIRDSGKNPHIATNGSGTWLMAWDSTGTSDTDIRYCRSTDNGNTWSAGNWLNSGATSDNGVFRNYDGQVRLAANSAGVWVAVWTSSYDPLSTVPVTDRIVFARSQDDGATWSVPAPIDPLKLVGTPAEQMPDVVWSGTQFALIWSGPSGLEASYSSTGATWATPVAVAASPGFEGGPESRPRLATGSASLRLTAWIRRPAGATGPDIIAAQDAIAAGIAEWNLYW